MSPVFDPAVPRILHVCAGYPPHAYGGMATTIAALRAVWPYAASRVLSCGEGNDLAVGDARVRVVRSFSRSPSMPLAPAWPARFWQEAAAADLVAVHAPFALAELAAALHVPSRAALVVHWHRRLHRRWLTAAPRAVIARALLSRAELIVVPDPSIADDPLLVPHYRKLAIVPTGVDGDAWNVAANGYDTWRGALLRTHHRRLVVAVGRLVPDKGFQVLIEAMRDVDAHLLVIGEGPLHAALQRQIAEIGLASRVTLCGAVPTPELRLLLHTAQVCAFPSLQPRTVPGLAQLEAMACGRPVVTTGLGHQPPIIAGNRPAALAVPPDQPGALTAALTLLLQDPALAERLGAAGRIYVQTYHAVANFRHRIKNLYDHALVQRGQPVVRSVPQASTVGG